MSVVIDLFTYYITSNISAVITRLSWSLSCSLLQNEEESSTLPGDGRNGQSSALIPACNNEPIGQSSASLIPVCSDEPIGQSSALTPVSGNEQ